MNRNQAETRVEQIDPKLKACVDNLKTKKILKECNTTSKQISPTKTQPRVGLYNFSIALVYTSFQLYGIKKGDAENKSGK